MTKKHFIALADAFRSTRHSYTASRPTVDGCDQWVADMYAVARVCADANPRFNKQRWIGYIFGECGPNGGKLK